MEEVVSATEINCDVAIIGAGPTGLTLANLLGQAGVDVALIERNPTTVQAPRAVSIDDESLRTIQACGMEQAAIADIALDYGAHYFTPSGICFAKVEPKNREYGYPRRSAFLQPVLEATLRSGLERFPNIRQYFSHTVEGIEEREDEVQLSITGPDGSPLRLRTKWLAGCDGGRSLARKHVGAELIGETYGEKWLIVDLADTKERMRQTRVLCNPDRPAICLPGPDNKRRYEFMLHKGEVDEEMEKLDNVKRLLRENGPDENATIVRRQVYHFHARVCDKWRTKRVFLAGDAAHLTPPFAGQGMNSGVRDAHALSWRLIAVTRGDLGPGIFDSYPSERAPHARSLIEMAQNIGKVMMPTSHVQAFFVHWAFRLMRFVPPLHAYFAQMKYKPKPFYKDGFIVGAMQSKLAGRMIYQPNLEHLDRSRSRLDDLTGSEFALIAYGDNSQANIAASASMDFGIPNVRRLAIVPMRMNIDRTADPSIIAVRDIDDLMAGQMPEGETLVFVRPDRYIMAATHAPTNGIADAASLARSVRELVDATRR
jgi:3-(3-hydroxy-phenyl)propionate hydroxylase